jgi:hypothetical protein
LIRGDEEGGSFTYRHRRSARWWIDRPLFAEEATHCRAARMDREPKAGLRGRGVWRADLRRKRGPLTALLVGILPGLALSACGGMGPAILRTGRGAYNDVIARTNSEQMLALIVRLRYSDPIGLTTVASVTANLRFSAQAAAEAGIGSESDYSGNLVPFSAGVVYEDNPTISYAPVDTRAFLRTWLRPLPLEILASAMEVGNANTLLPMLVDRMNGLRSGPAATAAERTDFARAATLLQQLRDLGIAAWVKVSEPSRKSRHELLLDRYAPGHTAEVQELLQLLEIPAESRRGKAIAIPLAAGVRRDGAAELFLRTRSVSTILSDAARLVDVPEEHLKAGFVVPNVLVPNPDEPTFRIYSSRRAPEHANVAVRHRDWWYYIDDTDLVSKNAFQLIQLLFASQLSEAARGAQTAPVLTIPVR